MIRIIIIIIITSLCDLKEEVFNYVLKSSFPFHMLALLRTPRAQMPIIMMFMCTMRMVVMSMSMSMSMLMFFVLFIFQFSRYEQRCQEKAKEDEL